MAAKGVTILEIVKGSAADALGIEPGDRIMTVNGHEISDELELRFHLSEECYELCIRKRDGSLEYHEMDCSDEGPGFLVEDFSTRTCGNACIFCFVDQLPPDARPTLKVKDDDYRLSFLHGNYITLTNLRDRDIQRIIEQRLSPLYVSVHATDPGLRGLILGRSRRDNLERNISKLTRGGIRIHAQIVLMPGINDGEQLKKTVFDLYEHYPGIQSIAIVPVGLSGHGKPKDRLRPVTADFCREVIRDVTSWQDRFRTWTGRTFVCLADEFYLQGGVTIPDRDHYDDFAQIEDGVGMVRTFLDDFETVSARYLTSIKGLDGTLVTGELFFPVLRQCISRLNRRSGSRLKVRKAVNRYLGGKITVAGLLAGQDVLAALEGENPGDFIVVPGEALSTGDKLMLDNRTLREVSRRIGKPVCSGGRTVHDFFTVLSKKARSIKRSKPQLTVEQGKTTIAGRSPKD
jgi:putative radical SAM enzyme (TIGR03279 family)